LQGEPAGRRASRERGKAEVAELGAAGGVEEHVRALEVAVDEALRMHRLERGRDGIDGARPAFEGPSAQLAEVAALEELHDEEHALLEALEPVDRDGVFGGEAARANDLALELSEAGGVADQGFTQELERDALGALAVDREPDFRAAAAADPSHQHKPGTEFEPGSQLLHGGSAGAAVGRGGRLRVRGGSRRRRRRHQPVSSL
jgi:hypothetical protein